MEKILKNVGLSEVFKVAGFEFIKFHEKDGTTVAVAKDSWFDSTFGDNNNFATSKILKRLQEEFLPQLEAVIGAENIMEHEVDLLSLDGSDKWGKINTKISLPTFDFYRHNVKIFDEHKLAAWWWLATSDCVSEHVGHDYYVSSVSPQGFMSFNNSNNDGIGVRPFLIFVSSISVSCESEE